MLDAPSLSCFFSHSAYFTESTDSINYKDQSLRQIITYVGLYIKCLLFLDYLQNPQI